MAGRVEGLVTARGIDVLISTLCYLKNIYVSNLFVKFSLWRKLLFTQNIILKIYLIARDFAPKTTQ